MKKNCILALVVVGTLALCSGCDENAGDPFDGSANQNFSRLMDMPDIDEATSNYGTMATHLRQKISNLFPEISSWRKGDTGNSAYCGSDQQDSEERWLPIYVADRNIPDNDWNRLVDAVASVAAKYNFDPKPLVLHDAPGSHDVAFHNFSDESRIMFGTAKATTLAVRVGCHLTAEAKRQGRPGP